MRIIWMLAFFVPAVLPGQTTSSVPLGGPAPREVRAVWISGYETRWPADKVTALLDSVKAAGFNTIAINFNFSGFVIYPNSAYSAQYSSYVGKPDILALLVREARNRGMRAELLSSDGFYCHRVPSRPEAGSGRMVMENPHLAQQDDHGNKQVKRLSDMHILLCPSNPEAVNMLAKLYVEAVSRYPVDGLAIHGFHYAPGNFCHCKYCRGTFKEDTGKDLAVFPDGSPEAKLWLDWKRRKLTRALQTVSKQVRAARPGISLMVYASSADPKKDLLGQSWDQWLDQGLVDATVLRLHDRDITQPLRDFAQVQAIERSKVIVGMVSTHTTADLIRNLEGMRACGAAGALIYSGKDLGQDDLDTLKTGLFAQPALSIFGPPIPESRDADTEQ